MGENSQGRDGRRGLRRWREKRLFEHEKKNLLKNNRKFKIKALYVLKKLIQGISNIFIQQKASIKLVKGIMGMPNRHNKP